MTSSSPRITLLSETKYDHRVPDGLPASCPTLDLSATWDESVQTLLICRPPDQVVSKIHQLGAGGRATPRALAWKPDGQFIAVGWSDGFVRLMSLENSKAAHHLQVTSPPSDSSDAPAPQITRIAWVRSRVGGSSHSSSIWSDSQSQSQSQQRTWRQILRSGPLELDAAADGDDDAELDEMAKLDLPTELAFLEVDASLPKISPLPSGSAGSGADAIIFTSRTGIEFLFQPLKREDTVQVHVMLVGTDDGSLHLSIYDSFAVGSFPPSAILSSSSSPPAPRLLTHHASHPDISTHALFLQSSSDPGSVYLTPMDIPFVASSPVNLALLASKLTTLQKLLRYLGQTQLHMQLEFKNARELPGRFIKSVQEELAKETDGGPRDIVQALYHTAVTGHLAEPVREWLVESVAERGHKRWDKAVKSGLENLRGLVHENLLPSLDRTAVILSRLRGLALFHSPSSSSSSSSSSRDDDVGFSAAQVSHIADAVAALTLIGHKVLLLVMDELDLFTAFSAWLRIRIDRASSSQPADDVAQEKEASIETAKVLAYIQHHLVPTLSPPGVNKETTTPLGVYLDEPSPEEIATASNDPFTDTGSLEKIVDGQLRHFENFPPWRRTELNPAFLAAMVCRRAEAMFGGIAEAQKRSVRFGRPTRLAMGNRAVSDLDATMFADESCQDGQDPGGRISVVMSSNDHSNELWLFETAIKLSNGISSTLTTRVCPIALPDGGSFIHAKFLNNRVLLALFRESQDAPLHLLALPLRLLDHAFEKYTERPSSPRPRVLGADILGNGEFRGLCAALPEEESLGEYTGSGGRGGISAVAPVRMEAQDVSDVRGRVSARVCLLAPSKTVWTTFALEV